MSNAFNIVTKMLLDDKEYTQKLNKAKVNTSDFQKELNSLGKKLGSDIAKGFTAVGAAIGAAGGAVETFKKFINATNESTDKWEASMRGLTNSVNMFFSSLRSGDFTSFTMGLDQIREKGRQAAQALDALGNASMSYDYFSSQYQAKFADAITDARDAGLSKADRDTAKATAEALLGKQSEITGKLRKKIELAISELMTESNFLSSDSVGILNLDNILRLDVSASEEIDKANLRKQYAAYQNEIAALRQEYTVTVGRTATGMAITRFQGGEEYQQRARQITEMYKDAVLYNDILNVRSDKWLQDLIALAKQADGADRVFTNMERTLNRVDQQLTNVAGSMSKVTAESEKVMPAIQMSGLANPSAGNSTTIATPAALQRQPLNITQDMLEQLSNEVDLEMQNEQLAQMAQIAPDAAEGINGITSAMSSLGSVLGQSAQSWVGWAANVLSSIGQAVPALMSLNSAQRGISTANTAAAATGAASAVASIPYVGPAMALAAIASIVAAVAAIPKFATGGIVPGTSYSGDNVLARVNSGEMILNRQQQALLSSRLEGAAGQVEFRIKGNELYGILNNYNRQLTRNI